MGSRREEERNEKIIRGLMKLPPNRKCINCNSAVSSGIHREFTHRVKSVSMAKFTTQELRALEQGGNQRARDIYLKDWDWQRMRLPVNTNPDRIREFIRAVYVDKKYAGGSSIKPAKDSESVKSNENDMRRPSSYHSYSQSPPYDFQYEDRRNGKQVDTLARRSSDGKLGNLLFSPSRLHEDRFANESTGSRFSDFSASSTGDFRNDVLSPSSQDTGYSSPSVNHSRNVSAENPQYQKYASTASQINFNVVRHSQRTASGSFGSFDGSSVSNKSTESSYPSSVNHHSTGSSVSHSTQSCALPPNKSFRNSSVQNTTSQKPVDLVSQTALTRLPVPAQPTEFTSLDLFDQSMIQQPVTSTGTIDLFAGFDEQSLSVSHKTIDSGSQLDVAEEHIQTVLVQKPSSVPAEASTTSQPVHQDLFSLPILQEPVTSSSASQIDLFAAFGQQLPHTSSAQQISSPAPSPFNEVWAFFDTQQHGSLTPSSHLQAQVPAAFPLTDGTAKGINQSTLPTMPQNVFGSQSSPAVMTNWSLNVEAVKAPISMENSQSWNTFGESTQGTSNNMFAFDTMCWNTFGESTQGTSNNMFAFNTMSQVAPHQSSASGVPYVGPRTAQDLARSVHERPTTVDMFSSFSASPDDISGPPYTAPHPHLGSMVSHPGKSTNLFDMAFESDVQANDMFMDLTSLQATLPDAYDSKDYSGSSTEPWISQYSTLPYVPHGPQGGLPYVAGQDSHILNSTHKETYPPRNPFE